MSQVAVWNPSPRYKWHVVAMLWWISFFNYADRQAIFSVFPLLEKEMGLSPLELGLLGSAFAWSYGLAAPLAGYVVDRVRRKTAILAGLHIWSVICALTALSRTFGQLLFFRAAEGLGETFYFPASMSLISDYHGKATRSRAMGLHQTSVYIGTIGGGFFAGLIGQYHGWRWSFIVFGALGILLGLVLARWLREAPRGAADRSELGVSEAARPVRLPLRKFLGTLGRTPSALLLLGAFLCANFVAVVLLSWMPKFLHDRFGMSLAMSGLTATVFVQLASMVGAPLGGWMADMLRRRTPRGRPLVQALGVLGGAPFVALCGLTPSVGVLVIALTAWGLFKGLYDANIFASVYDVIRPEARGTAAGFMNCVGWLGGGGTAPVIIGWIAQRESLGLAIALASMVYVLAGLLLLAAAIFFTKRDAERVEREILETESSRSR
ncbi:MAG: MFS transporter [Bryobacteraceae bacterium]|jgi:MFS family permease|nr:MFS transporter [Bryobacteraceae bacterium]